METIRILGREELGEDRGIARRMGTWLVEEGEVGVDVLSDNLEKVMKGVTEVLTKMECEVGKYRLEEVEIRVEISGNGSVSILGTGVETGGGGGLALKFKRSS